MWLSLDLLWYAKMIWPYPSDDYLPVATCFSLLFCFGSSVIRIRNTPASLQSVITLTSGFLGHLPETTHHSQDHQATSTTNTDAVLFTVNGYTEIETHPGLESHETRESDVGSNGKINNLCSGCLYLLCLDFLEICASKLTNEAMIT